MRHRAVFVGIDGVRFDALGAVATPHLDAVAGRGFLAPVTVIGPTISGPCWATMATGVEGHGIVGNEYPSAGLPDDALTIAAAAGLVSVAAAGWYPLVRPVDCGPIFRDPTAVILPPDPGDDLDAWQQADQFVAESAAVALADADLGFVYLGLADEIAHVRGVGPDYRAAIEACDRRLGIVLDALGALGPDSEWTVIVATDHGHVDAGGHGGDSPAERTAWIAACGPSIGPFEPADGFAHGPAARAPQHLRQADVFAQLLDAVGVPLPEGRDGLPFGARIP